MSVFHHGKHEAPPEWAREYVPETTTIAWHYHPKGGKWSYGCYDPTADLLHVHSSSREKTEDSVMVLLHERAHQLTPKNAEGFHSSQFWECAGELYAAAGILEYAKVNERYAKGRKHLAKM